MQRHRVTVGKDHVERQINTTPQRAVEELIWNALDAGGNRVDARVRFNELGLATRLEVIDRGPGIPPEDLERAFGVIGSSMKPQKKVNLEGRAYHGREGRGRFKALAICPVARWETTYSADSGRKKYTITLRREDSDYYSNSEPEETSGELGTRVILDDLDKGQQRLAEPNVRDWLAESFAVYLSHYPDVEIFWDGKPICIKEMIDRDQRIDLLSPADALGPAELMVIEWKFKPDDKRLHICDQRGFSYHNIPIGIQARGIELTAFLRSPHAEQWSDEGRFALEGLDQDLDSLIALAKERLRDYVRGRLAEQSVSIVQRWKDQQIYPFVEDEPSSPLIQVEREVFDYVAVQVHEVHPSFQKTDADNQRLTLALIRQALETNPSSLSKILTEVIALPKQEQDALAEFLNRAPLANLIRAGRLVADRLDVIQAFNHILFDEDWKARLLERTQLHRLLVHHLWILGEEYTLGSDDEGLRELLHQHRAILGLSELDPDVDVKCIDGKDGIPDLMLWRRRKLDRKRFEHLVVELKRPAEALGQEEISQIEKYAFTVTTDARFKTNKCQWEFVLLGNDLDPFASQRAQSDKLPEGCIHDAKGVRIWIKRWADVLGDAQDRYEFFRSQLEVQASHSQGLELLRRLHPHLFSGRGARKQRDLALSAELQKSGTR